MRKVLTNKKFVTKNDFENKNTCQCFQKPSIIFPKNVRHRIISNNWAQRNDSSHISAVLKPEIYQFSPHTKKTTAKVVRKCCLSTNTCYCREDTVKPKLIRKPKICIRENDLKQINNNLTRKSLECLCFENEHLANADEYDRKRDISPEFENNYLRSTLPLSRKLKIGAGTEVLNEDNGVKLDGIEVTEQRKDYEEFRQNELEEYLNKIAEYEQNEDELAYEYENDDVKTILSTKYPETFSTNHVTESRFQGGTNVDVRKFRNEHYFETHSTDPVTDVTGHKCTHQFRLDDRLLPEAINRDAFGRSMCSICDKPMEGSSVSLDKSYFGSVQPSKTSIRNWTKCYNYEFTPKTIYMSNTNPDKSKIEVKLSKEEFTKLDGLLSKMKKMQFCNSLALRQQRMSL